MKVHEKRNKQICGELLNEIVDKVFVQKESATKRKCEEIETDEVIEVDNDKLNEQE